MIISPDQKHSLKNTGGDTLKTLDMALLLLHLIRADNPEQQETQQNYQKDISLEDIAETLGYNKSYLCQTFRRYYHSTPMRFLYAFRVQAAKKLIQTSDFDLKQIAGMTGFNSIHHFTRTFSSTVGMSPGTYRNREKGTICGDINVDENFQNQLYVTRYTGHEDN